MVHRGEKDREEIAALEKTFGTSWIASRRAMELGALLSPDVRRAVEENQIELITFAALAEE